MKTSARLRHTPPPGGLWITLLASCLVLCSTAIAQQARDSEHPLGRWDPLEGCRLVPNTAVDGDSFEVHYNGRNYRFRLYFVDAPEVSSEFKDRLEEQAGYFGISAAAVQRGAKKSAQFTRTTLSNRSFTVLTRWENCLGRGKLPRFCCIVLVQGRSLADHLVSQGLARVHGFPADWPDGNSSTNTIQSLKKLETAAREQGRGLWNRKQFPATDKGAMGATLRPMDINKAAYEELLKLPGIGPKLAERIIANRPYGKVDDLLKIKGIGAKNLETLRPLVQVEGEK